MSGSAAATGRAPRWTRVADGLLLLRLSARSLAGRWFWAVPLLPLVWTAFLGLRLVLGGRTEYLPYEGQGLMAAPMAVLAILLGVRIIAGEIDRRTLEIAYTVPGGTHRVWLTKFLAALLMLVLSEAALALAVFVFFTSFPVGALYGALQAGTFYLALGMAFSALFKSEITGALVSIGMLAFNGLITGFGGNQIRISPFWNPWVPLIVSRYDAASILAWTIQNRIGFALATTAVVALAIARAENREKLLG